MRGRLHFSVYKSALRIDADGILGLHMDDAPRLLSGTPRPPLSTPERVGAILLVLIGFTSLVTGSLYLWHHMASPFKVSYFGPKMTLGDEQRALDVAKQRKEDTDKDGLSDYDERNIFFTSAYLADSDSDGVSDSAEVKGGTDPNCAPNAPCARAESDAVNLSGDADALLKERQKLSQEIQRIQSSLSTLENVSPDQIRQMLVESGLPQDQVSAMTDDELKEIYGEVLKQIQQMKGGLEGLGLDTPGAATASPQAEGTVGSEGMAPVEQSQPAN